MKFAVAFREVVMTVADVVCIDWSNNRANGHYSIRVGDSCVGVALSDSAWNHSKRKLSVGFDVYRYIVRLCALYVV